VEYAQPQFANGGTVPCYVEKIWKTLDLILRNHWDTLFTYWIFHAQDYGFRAMWRTANGITQDKETSKRLTSLPSASINDRQWIPKTHERREVTIVSNGIRLLHLWDCSLFIALFFRDIRDGVDSALGVFIFVWCVLTSSDDITY